ncbi:MAG TPA: ROK family protein [Candidatus Eremiobacteraceae bacterium]|nr:ROK family protein [Candidatus Eremiobacteraceae bacterium]
MTTAKHQIQSVRHTRIPNFLDGCTPEATWDAIVTEIAGYAAAAETLIAPDDPIVFAFPGPIRDRSAILAAPTVVGSEAAIPDIAADLYARTGRRVVLLNDVSAAAWYLSERFEVNRFMVVTVSSGIGSKIFDRRHPSCVLDDVAYGGEIGHAQVDKSPSALVCDCGGRGHLGAIASGRGTERLARRYARDVPARFAVSSVALKFGATADTLTNESHLVPAGRDGDLWSLAVIKEAAAPLATVISTVVHAAGIEKVIVIGGFAIALGPVYLECLQAGLRALDGQGPASVAVDRLIVLGDVDSDTCLRGAAVFADRMTGAGSAR